MGIFFGKDKADSRSRERFQRRAQKTPANLSPRARGSIIYSETRCFSSHTRKAASSSVLVRASVPALGRSGTPAADVLRFPVRGRPRGLALALLTLRVAPSLSGRFARFIANVWEQLPSQYARKRIPDSTKTACSLFTSPSLCLHHGQPEIRMRHALSLSRALRQCAG